MLLSQRTQLSLESVKNQVDSKLFSLITASIQHMRDSAHSVDGNIKKDAKIIKASGIEKQILKSTGLNIKFMVSDFPGYNAFVMPPTLDKNHPLLDDVRRSWSDNKDAVKRIKATKSAISGSIDLDAARVSGVYSEIKTTVSVTSAVINGALLTVEEVAALVMHELGHLMSYYEYLGRTVILNHILGDLVVEFNGTATAVQRVDIIKEVNDVLDLDAVDPDAVAKIKSGEAVQTLILFEYANKWNSATKTHLYDQRTWEALADQFVGRLGAARDLATGLDKILRASGDVAYRSNLKFLVLEVAKVLVTIPLHGTLLLIMLLAEPWVVYDPPEARLKRIRGDLVNTTKDPKISPEYRVRLQEDIDTINDLLKNIDDRSTVMETLWKALNSNVRKQTNKGKLMQDLEELSNNSLFEVANKLKSA